MSKKHNVNRHEQPRVVSVERKARLAVADRQPPRLVRELLCRDDFSGGIPGYSYAIREHGPQATPQAAQPPADYAPPLGFVDPPTIHTAYAIVGSVVFVLTLLAGIAIGATL